MNAATRAAIAEALNTVDGIKAHTRQPATLKAGTAWPLWGGGTRDEDSMGFAETWRIMIICDQVTADAADRFLDTYGEAVLDALVPVMFVDAYAPAKVATEAGDLYALMITGRSE